MGGRAGVALGGSWAWQEGRERRRIRMRGRVRGMGIILP
jgi:hypothetical protein